MCQQTTTKLGGYTCGKKWGEKVEKKEAGDSKYIPKQCPKCKKKMNNRIKGCKYEYICPMSGCRKGHGQKYKKGEYANTTTKRCSKHKKSKKSEKAGGFFSSRGPF